MVPTAMGTEMDQELAKIKSMIPDNLPEYVNRLRFIWKLVFPHGGTEMIEKASHL